jgi:hypothetical protein
MNLFSGPCSRSDVVSGPALCRNFREPLGPESGAWATLVGTPRFHVPVIRFVFVCRGGHATGVMTAHWTADLFEAREQCRGRPPYLPDAFFRLVTRP